MGSLTTALVTGGAGFLGSHLCERLIAEGVRVRVLDDLSSGHAENLEPIQHEIEFEHGSIADSACVQRMAQGCDAIFHLAALVSVQRSFSEAELSHDANATGTLNVIQAAMANGAKLVYSSSAAVYGQDVPVPVDEHAALAPISPYGAQKLYGEGLIRSFAGSGALQAVSLRYFNIYGPRQDANSPYSGVISIFHKRLLAGQPITIYGDGSQTRDFIHVSDVVEANLCAVRAEVGGGEAFNVGTGRATSLLELIHTMEDVLGKKADLTLAEPRVGDIKHSSSNPSRAKQSLGFAARVELREGLQTLR